MLQIHQHNYLAHLQYQHQVLSIFHQPHPKMAPQRTSAHLRNTHQIQSQSNSKTHKITNHHHIVIPQPIQWRHIHLMSHQVLTIPEVWDSTLAACSNQRSPDPEQRQDQVQVSFSFARFRTNIFSL